MPPKDKTVKQETKFSQSEDTLIRAFLYQSYSIKLPENYFWKLTPSEAIRELYEDHPQAEKLEIDAAELEKAARR